MCMECNKNVVQCLLHFINLKTNFRSARAHTRSFSHTHTISFPLFFCFNSPDAAVFCLCICSLTTGCLCCCCWWPIPTITRWVATPIIDKLNGNICDGRFFSFLSSLVVLSLDIRSAAAAAFECVQCSIWFGVCAFRNSICKLIDSYTHSL